MARPRPEGPIPHCRLPLLGLVNLQRGLEREDRFLPASWEERLANGSVLLEESRGRPGSPPDPLGS